MGVAQRNICRCGLCSDTHTHGGGCLKSKVHLCHRLLIKRPVVRSGSRPHRHMVSLCLHDDPSLSCFLSNEVVLSGGCVTVSWSCCSSPSSDLLLNFICLSTSGSNRHGHMTQSQEVLITRVLFPPDLAAGSECIVSNVIPFAAVGHLEAELGIS